MIQKFKCRIGLHSYRLAYLVCHKYIDGFYLFKNHCIHCDHQDRFWNTEREMEKND